MNPPNANAVAATIAPDTDAPISRTNKNVKVAARKIFNISDSDQAIGIGRKMKMKFNGWKSADRGLA